MNRVWSLLTPTVTGRRGRGVLVLILAVLVPVTVLMTLVPSPGAERVPAALVNLDTPVQESVNGAEVPVAAGKVLTENLVSDPRGIAWTLTDPATARAGLASGAFLAVVTIPSGFSQDAGTLTGDSPTQATVQVETSTAHGYLLGAVAEALTANLPSGVSAQLTEQYVGGTLGAFADLHDGVGQAASAASEISDAIAQAAGGADQIATATDRLTSGLEEIAGVLRALPAGADDLGALTAAGAAEAAGLSLGLAGSAVAAEEALRVQRSALGATDALLAWVREHPDASASDVLSRLEDLRRQTADVEARLARQSEELGVGAADAAVLAVGAGAIASISGPVADGLGKLADAAADAREGSALLGGADRELATGLDRLADGSTQLAGALSAVSAATPDYTADQQKQIASVVSSPIAVEHTAAAGPASAELSAVAAVAPVGLWLGALVVLLVLAPFARSSLTSPATAGRIAMDGAVVAGGIACVQALAVWVALALLGVTPGRLPVALAFTLVLAGCVMLIHQVLTAALGRAGFIASAVLLAVQLVAAGTLAPASLAPAAGSPLSLLPLSLGLQGAQALVGGSLHGVLAAAVGLALWACAALGGTMAAITVQRRRNVAALVRG